MNKTLRFKGCKPANGARGWRQLCAVATVVGVGLVLRGLTGTAAQPATVVSVSGGQIRGALVERGGAMFKGIPFARAPVGDHRWREPAPVVPWRGVKDAVVFTPPCAQSAMSQADLAPISSEDCLYLNVWTPDWPPRSHRPVMVWIPGGGNFGGTANAPRFDGEALTRHDVVVVTVNYRLSLFGFLAHPALTQESAHHASGNYALLDQIAALQWVKDNIAPFGGNKDEVTIFGESAGSFDVSFLMTSPLAKGLFQRAIAESGTVTTLGEARSLSEAERDGEALMNRVEVAGPRTLGALRQAPVSDILKVEPPYLTSPPQSLLAVVDGYVLPAQPSAVFSAGQAHRVPLMIGNAARERVPGTTLPSDLVATIKDTYGPLAAEALALYGLVDGASAAVHSRYGTAAEQWATDTSFRCSSVVAAAWHAAAGNATYEYEFDRVPKGRESVGAVHASELPYVFGVLTPFRNATFDDVDALRSREIRQYWTSFAKTGDPNSPGLPKWPAFHPLSPKYLAFTDDGPVARENLRQPFCRLYARNLERIRAR